MEEGDIFAIETFGTTGRGYLRDGVGFDVSSFVSNPNIFETARCLRLWPERACSRAGVITPQLCQRHLQNSTRKLWYTCILSPLPRSSRDGSLLGRRTYSSYAARLQAVLTILQINCLVSNGILESYPPLMDIPGSYSAQFEHVRLASSTSKVLSLIVADNSAARGMQGSAESWERLLTLGLVNSSRLIINMPDQTD